MSISVRVESEPHTKDTSGMLLTRPAPKSGSFLVSQQIDRPTWFKMKEAGADYYSRNDLEEFDMFDAEPGWRYSLGAIEELLEAGHTLIIRDTEVQTQEQLHALFTPEAIAAYHQRLQDERAERERLERERLAQQKQERQARGEAYKEWQQAHLRGLHYSTVAPRDLVWIPSATFAKGTPGTWYDTGDRWEQALVDGQAVYRCLYGNAVNYYAPQAIVEQWYRQRWEDPTPRFANDTPGSRALHALDRVLQGAQCYGDDYSLWVVRAIGIDELLRLARAESPLLDTNHQFALASKVYRVPIQVRVHNPALWKPGGNWNDSHEFHVGYGRYGWHSSGLPAEQQARTERLHAWIPLGQEETGQWPTEDDLAAERQKAEAALARWSTVFGGGE